ncbi:SDR family NAD(P)-dependent oxidoreductase [Halomonas hibernica]|uniref:SDR family NAD(P)-dependent oxidoreductase n=1 Tax=Halomonas hibernica TaxID=2591147 RepID=UPI0015575A6F|nr:SDR family NAD(P)-dependent oxidoreductase [Halomonas hibernica]
MVTKKVAVVTGGARGIGLAAVEVFLAKGYDVAVVDMSYTVANELAETYSGVLPIECDVSNPDDVIAMAAVIERQYGRVDALVNNAGIAALHPIEETGFDSWKKIMSVNLDGTFLVTQALTPLMKKVSGAIVNVASIAGLRASTLRTAYGTSKAAVIHLTKQQAMELGEHGIRANCVAPGPVETELLAKLVEAAPEMKASYLETIPLNRFGQEKEIAEVIAFLCSPEGGYVTGQTIAVDGGFQSAGVGLTALRSANNP